ncbi:FAD-dependent monooxygenase [Micromonospora endophytica]|uniref:2-polyprenyl-6-methoxyphenol hydroxylase n=1 Tax=Micromonospora endophytica TaxID=515350 RepID=A0A2W2DRB1_9ACTN|nr:FAD-dependent monooxygenase [Micromonospora endophytica]PZF95253.1 2-polyprenyl-6-methoxyphenol hydroxylase [Micromonospora endophytica]RIW50829.1 2-polyprenyl-6-methoxyphenol hydroxylase [Micromonospora endophytica]BCJ58398.1 FAD-dependent oxidoreductase [Micromonospora endophytica]
MIPVLIVGGGPVGLSLAIRLAQLGVPSTLVERHPTTATFPKGRALSIRSMEIYRFWGLEPEITAAALPRDHLAFYTGRTLVDPSGTRIVTNPAARPSVASPTYTLLCSQDRLEPLLRSHAERLNPGRIHFGTRLAALYTAADHAIAELVTGTRRHLLTARWVVAADGARSAIRDRLGIAMNGPTQVSHNLNILFDADLGAHVADRPSAVYTISRPDLHGTFLAVDNQRRWLFNLVADRDGSGLDRVNDSTCVAMIRSAAGLADLPISLVARQVWHAAAQVADQFRAGPVLLAGDAAHVTTPYGGFGLNCGIADADNLAWKLAAVHHGWAAPPLIDTYHDERRPVATASATESHLRLADALAAHRAGVPPRARSSDGLILGYHYASASVVPDGTAAPPGDPVTDHHPTGRPGHRLPHAWLDDNQSRSTLDVLASDGFTLLVGGDTDAAFQPMVNAARQYGVPVLIHPLNRLFSPARLERYLDTCGIGPDGGLLVRPDGHVAWRQSVAGVPPHDLIVGLARAELNHGVDR